MNDVVQTGNGWRLGGSKHVNPRTEKILIVDDTVMTGNSLRAIKPLIDREFGNAVAALAGMERIQLDSLTIIGHGLRRHSVPRLPAGKR